MRLDCSKCRSWERDRNQSAAARGLIFLSGATRESGFDQEEGKSRTYAHDNDKNIKKKKKVEGMRPKMGGI